MSGRCEISKTKAMLNQLAYRPAQNIHSKSILTYRYVVEMERKKQLQCLNVNELVVSTL